jgi:hypothetical protein
MASLNSSSTSKVKTSVYIGMPKMISVQWGITYHSQLPTTIFTSQTHINNITLCSWYIEMPSNDLWWIRAHTPQSNSHLLPHTIITSQTTLKTLLYIHGVSAYMKNHVWVRNITVKFLFNFVYIKHYSMWDSDLLIVVGYIHSWEFRRLSTGVLGSPTTAQSSSQK